MIGVQCLRHMIREISPTELKWFGRTDLINDTLTRLVLLFNIIFILLYVAKLLFQLTFNENEFVDTVCTPPSIMQHWTFRLKLKKYFVDRKFIVFLVEWMLTKWVIRPPKSDCIFKCWTFQMHSKEIQLLEVLFPCLIEFLDKVEGPKNCTERYARSQSRFSHCS